MECIFCNIDNQRIENTILYETKYFYVLPTVGSLVRGYILIVSKRHINSMAELNNNEKTEYDFLINKFRDSFNQKYNKFPIVFEHGSPNLNSEVRANSVVHAHTHIVNHNFEDENNIIKELNFNKIPNINCLTKDSNYIMYINQNNICYTTNNFKPISQIMRKLIAKDLGYENKFDWKKEKFIGNINKTINDMKDI